AAAALVYPRHDVERGAASAFVFILCTSTVLFGLAHVLFPPFAALFPTPALTNVLRGMSLLLITRAFGTIPLALLERNIDFRTRSVCELSGALAQAAGSLRLAFSGFRVWGICFG